MITYAELIEAKQIAASGLQDSLARGDIRALGAIGATYENGVFSEPDPYLAYAYMYAASQTPDADLATLPWVGKNLFSVMANGIRTQDYYSRTLSRLGASLSPERQAEARQLGLELYAQCCKAPGT